VSDPELALGALAAPLASAAITPLLRLAGLQRFAHVPAILSFATAAVFALLLLAHTYASPLAVVRSEAVTWFAAGTVNVEFRVAVDSLAAVMLATVTFIATWIAVFSAGYMKGDSGYDRYFAVMSLFVFSMCLLVLANNLLLLLSGWEGVGLCSYLLVGYYYAKPSAAAAARKAFLVTRLGDAVFLFGIFLVWRAGGYHFDFGDLFAHLKANPPKPGLGLSIGLCLFAGAVGKSAQFPLYVWLPDAMEGPTPVSALIHAATMVTAGVYLLARMAPFFVLSPASQAFVTATGAFTALLAAFFALAQTDLKRILAYSTVSQLGYMFVALGCSGAVTPGLAVAAAIFHLYTHAFFKALLFLGSGSVMHAMGNVIDVRKFGGLRKLMPVTHLTFLAGAAALAGLPPLAGFWSKDQILDVTHNAADVSRYPGVYLFAFAACVLTAGLTAFYTFRAYFLTFWGEERIPPEAHGHAHESPRGMLLPLVVLGAGAVFAGVAVEPFGHGFSGFLGRSPSVTMANDLYTRTANLPVVAHPHFSWAVAATGTAVALAGLGVAFALYRKGGPVRVPASVEPVRALSANKLFVDEIYGATVVRPAEMTATAARQFDGVIDSLGRLVGYVPRVFASAVRPLQNGLVQYYALGTVLGLAVFLALVAVRATR
jgi:proton-translocating NADH-quinone oxidoreductase chain L